MTDQELIEWIKGLKDNNNMPQDTSWRMIRLMQILVDWAEPERTVSKVDNTLHLSKPRMVKA